MLEAGLAAGAVTLAATPVVLAGMRRQTANDGANGVGGVGDPSSKQVTTPSGGGVAVVLGVYAGVTVLVLSGGTDEVPAVAALSVAVCLLGLIGLAEDLAPVPALQRLGYQAVAGLAVTAVALATVWVTGPEPGGALVLGCALVGPLWVTAFVNAFNVMDGVNGVSTVQAVVAGVAFAVLGSLHDVPTLTAAAAVVASAAAGFAPFNVHRARIFLGGVGSHALGAALAVLAMLAVLAGIAPEAVIAPLAIYLADTGTTLLRRVRAGETWHQSRRWHVYHRLAALPSDRAIRGDPSCRGQTAVSATAGRCFPLAPQIAPGDHVSRTETFPALPSDRAIRGDPSCRGQTAVSATAGRCFPLVVVGGYVAVLSGMGVAAAGSTASGRARIDLMILAVVGSYLALPRWASVLPRSATPRKTNRPVTRPRAAKVYASGAGRHRPPGRHRTPSTGRSPRVPAQRQKAGNPDRDAAGQ